MERGVTELGVSEHIHRFSAALDVWQHPFWREQASDDIDAYCQFVREQTDLRLGLEVDFIPGREDRTQNLIERLELDFVVGSVHFLGERAVDHEDYDVWQDARSPEAVWDRYFETLGEAARSGLFDILAHPDLVKMWGAARPHPDGDLRRFYDRAMEGIAESGIAVEVSTAGLRKPVGELYPAPAFLEMSIDAGSPIALSSDAHTAEHVGFAYDVALEALDRLGVGELATFSGRERRLAPIG
jgi:histidinol-phosphatase (PHP family)